MWSLKPNEANMVICMCCLEDFELGKGTGTCKNAFCSQDCEDTYSIAAVRSLTRPQLDKINSILVNHKSQHDSCVSENANLATKARAAYAGATQ